MGCASVHLFERGHVLVPAHEEREASGQNDDEVVQDVVAPDQPLPRLHVHDAGDDDSVLRQLGGTKDVTWKKLLRLFLLLRMRKKKADASVEQFTLTTGDWLDVMDEVGVWNAAQVVSSPSEDEIRVRFLGWGEREEENVDVNSDRVAPFHTYTWTVKCWAKCKNWPFWPALFTVQTPGSASGAKCLKKLESVFVDFAEDWRYSHRTMSCWTHKSAIRPFNVDYDTFRAETNGPAFELALERVLCSTATPVLPHFVRGVLVRQFAMDLVKPVPATRRSLGSQLWFKELSSGRERFAAKFACRKDSVGFGDSADAGAGSPTLEEQVIATLNPDILEVKRWLQDGDESDTGPQRKRRGRSVRQPQPKRQRASVRTQRPPALLYLNDKSAVPRREIAAKERKDPAGASALARRSGAQRGPFVREIAAKEREDFQRRHTKLVRCKSPSVQEAPAPARSKAPSTSAREIKEPPCALAAVPSAEELFADFDNMVDGTDDNAFASESNGGDALPVPALDDALTSPLDEPAQPRASASEDALPAPATGHVHGLLADHESAIEGDEPDPLGGVIAGGWASPESAFHVEDLLACFDDDDDDEDEEEGGDAEEKNHGDKSRDPPTLTVDERDNSEEETTGDTSRDVLALAADERDKSEESDKSSESDEAALEHEAKRGESPPPRRVWRSSRAAVPHVVQLASCAFAAAGRRRVGQQTKKQPLGSLVALAPSHPRERVANARDAQDATAADSPSVLQGSSAAGVGVRPSDAFCASAWLAATMPCGR
ncbi:hypothetical protein PybrP1_008880 [[Pythium] brassicae (nom. inval.)]|nr:hypothetical protein PybrP1_008880 [[Pythium] brassicae (nom. inval.)]